MTTYRLTEHFTAGGMTRWTPVSRRAAAGGFFCEIARRLWRGAAGAGAPAGCGTFVTARGVVECPGARDRAHGPVDAWKEGRRSIRIGMPYHWGPNGLARRGLRERARGPRSPWTATCTSRRSKALTRGHPAGRATPRARPRPALVREYRERAGAQTRGGAMTRERERPIGPDCPSPPRFAAARPGPGRRAVDRRAAAPRLLHRHVDLHRLQGVRGGLQGVERRARGRAPADRDVLRQHRSGWGPRPGGTLRSSSRSGGRRLAATRPSRRPATRAG